MGKAWDFHVKTALEIKNEENLENIRDTAKHIIKNGKEYLTFAEKLKRDMKSEVMRKYGNDIKDFFNPFK